MYHEYASASPACGGGTTIDHRSEEAAAYRKLYDTARWKRLREAQLMTSPLCRFCLEVEDVTAADTVDHVEPHRGQLDMFFDPANLQSLCKSCHDTHKRRMELGKNVIRFSPDGWPL